MFDFGSETKAKMQTTKRIRAEPWPCNYVLNRTTFKQKLTLRQKRVVRESLRTVFCRHSDERCFQHTHAESTRRVGGVAGAEHHRPRQLTPSARAAAALGQSAGAGPGAPY